jgi:hypothetical protein
VTKRRASPGYGYEPCQGCGETPENQRLKGTLCPECRILLDTAHRAKHDVAKRGDLVTVATPQSPGDMPYLNEYNDMRLEWRDQNQFAKALHELMLCVSEKAPTDDRWSVGADARLFEEEDSYTARRRSNEARVMHKAVAEALPRVFIAAKAMVERAHEDGKARGQSLLARLASGEITADEFNKNAARLEDDPT